MHWIVFLSGGFELIGSDDDCKDRRADCENSGDERRKSKMGSLRKKAANASNKFTRSLSKRGKRKSDSRVPRVPIEDIRDPNEEVAVNELRQKLLDMNLLPVNHDNYHMLLRYVYFSRQIRYLCQS